MGKLIEDGGGGKAPNMPDNVGETMKDSMSETPPNNDNTLLPNVDELTDDKGRLDAEAFKKTYQQDENSAGEQ